MSLVYLHDLLLFGQNSFSHCHTVHGHWWTETEPDEKAEPITYDVGPRQIVNAKAGKSGKAD